MVLWFGGAVRGRTALLTLLAAGAALVGAHTRTALLAMIVGLVVAGASMFIGHARVRRTSALLGVLGVIVATLFAPLIVDWFWRGQSAEEAAQLTGRTKVWTEIVGLQRPWLEEVFGSGLSNKSFNGLPIDSNWLAVYLDQGWFGVVIDATLLLVLIFLAVTHRRGIRRATALFLVAYCLVASITETGLGDASPYLLHLFVAASLLAAPVGRGATMKILIVHNRYRPTAPSGEDAVVDQESSALSSRGHDVVLFQRRSEEIAAWSPLRRATLPVRVLWSGDSRRAITESLVEFAPDVVHIHNIFPLVTPSILYACRDASVPVVATVHNYKLGCASGTLFRDGRVCHDCLGGSSLPALAHGCYRGSTALTAPVVLGSWLHRSAWRTMITGLHLHLRCSTGPACTGRAPG